MKKTKLILMIAIVIASFGASAQNVNLNYVKIDSVTNITPTSARFWYHLNGETGVGYSEVCYGFGGNYNLNCSLLTPIGPVADTTFFINVTGLTPLTVYSYKGKLLPGSSSGTTTVGTFTTLACFPTPVVSSSNGSSFCSAVWDTLTVSSSGGIYQWKKGSVNITGATSQTYITNTSGNYSCDVTIAGCTESSSSFTLTYYPQWTFATGNATICFGDSVVINGSIASSYLWSTGATTASIKVSPITTTSYTVTGTNSYGCSLSSVSTVTVNPSPVVNVSPASPSICFGSSAILTASGASTYHWSTGGTTSSIIATGIYLPPNVTTLYSVTGTNANGCTAIGNAIVTVNGLPTATVTPNSSICFGLSNVLAAAGGTSFSWSPALGLSSTTLASVTANPTSTTTYTVTVTDANGCVKNVNTTVTVNPLPNVCNGTLPGSFICNGHSVSLTGCGASTYNWMPGNLSGVSINVSPTTNTTYTVVGTDANGCSSSGFFIVNVKPNSSSTQTLSICQGASVNVGGNVHNTTGIFTDHLVSSNGCDSVVTTNLTVNSLPTVTASASSGTVCAGGATTLTGGGANTYSWSNGQSIASFSTTPTVTTIYNVTGTDANGCVNTAAALVTVNSVPAVTLTASPSVICANASSILTGGGGVSYVWNTGQTVSSINVAPLVTTTYTLTGTGSNTCSKSVNITITVNPQPIATVTANDSICIGSSKSLTAAGGISCSWFPSASLSSSSGFSVTASPTVTTIYSAVLTDIHGCTDTAITKVKVNLLPIVTAVATPVAVCASTPTNLSAGGALTYLWGGGQTSPTLSMTPNTSTTYTVTGTDANGCVKNATVSVVVNSLPIVTATANHNSICTGASSTLSGGGAVSYVWNTGQTVSPITVTPNNSFTYSVIGTGANGCTNNASVTVNVNSLPIVSAVAGNSFCIGGSTTITGTGGSSYSWSPSANLSSTNLASATANPTSTKTYTVTVTDINGCVDTASVAVIVYPLPVVTISNGNTTICSGTSASLSASGANTYSWTGGLNGSPVVVSPTVATSYMATGTDIHSCVNHSNVITVTPVTNNAPVTITSNLGIIAICKEATDHMITFTGSPVSSTGVFSANGIPFVGNTFNAATANAGVNTITYTYYDGFGCSKSASTPERVDSVPIIDSVKITGIGTNKTVSVYGLFGSNLELKTDGSTAHVYTTLTQNNTHFIYHNVNLTGVSTIFFQFTTSGCFYEYAALGVGVVIKDEDVKVFPNPFTDVLHVEVPHGKYQINIVNNLGQVVRSMNEEGNNFQILKNDLPQGLYLVKIISSNSIINKKVLIE